MEQDSAKWIVEVIEHRFGRSLSRAIIALFVVAFVSTAAVLAWNNGVLVLWSLSEALWKLLQGLPVEVWPVLYDVFRLTTVMAVSVILFALLARQIRLVIHSMAEQRREAKVIAGEMQALKDRMDAFTQTQECVKVTVANVQEKLLAPLPPAYTLEDTLSTIRSLQERLSALEGWQVQRIDRIAESVQALREWQDTLPAEVAELRQVEEVGYQLEELRRNVELVRSVLKGTIGNLDALEVRSTETSDKLNSHVANDKSHITKRDPAKPFSQQS